MLFWFWVFALLLFSAVGSIRLRAASRERYAPFVYACATGWALIPATTGDYAWMFATIPAAIVVAPVILHRRPKVTPHSASPTGPPNVR